MAIEIIERPAITVVGMSIRTKPMSPEIPALWPKFVARIPKIQNQNEPRVTYGVMRDEKDVLLYTAAVAVSAAGRVPQGMESFTIPASAYAVFRYPLSGLAKGFGEIFKLSVYGMARTASDYVQVSAPYLERYDESFNPHDSSSAVQICIAVRRRSQAVNG